MNDDRHRGPNDGGRVDHGFVSGIQAISLPARQYTVMHPGEEMRQRPDSMQDCRDRNDVKWAAASLRMSLRAVGAAYISEYEI
jgi:hypothetical protein